MLQGVQEIKHQTEETMLALRYSKINQAYLFMWNNTVMGIFNTMEEAAQYLRAETSISSPDIARLLDGRSIN
jgi:hypothetical protein